LLAGTELRSTHRFRVSPAYTLSDTRADQSDELSRSPDHSPPPPDKAPSTPRRLANTATRLFLQLSRRKETARPHKRWPTRLNEKLHGYSAYREPLTSSCGIGSVHIGPLARLSRFPAPRLTENTIHQGYAIAKEEIEMSLDDFKAQYAPGGTAIE
jgi:hypothetical protein